jgi:hypothetical protein
MAFYKSQNLSGLTLRRIAMSSMSAQADREKIETETPKNSASAQRLIVHLLRNHKDVIGVYSRHNGEIEFRWRGKRHRIPGVYEQPPE